MKNLPLKAEGPFLSVVVPVYNEGTSVHVAHQRISAVLASMNQLREYEIVFVDDGSQDDSFDQLAGICARDRRVTAIRLAVNCGAHIAIRAGLEHCHGDQACFLACDLQDPPELIPELLEALTPQTQVVWAVRNNRHDPFFSRLSASIFYWLARALVSKNIPPAGASMFLLGTKMLNLIRQYRERHLTLEGFLATRANRHAYVLYDRRSRQVGKSKWSFAKKVNLFVDFFTGYSLFPIRVLFIGGTVMIVPGLVVGGYSLALAFLGQVVSTTQAVCALILFAGGAQLIGMGLLGEYLWRALDEARQQPLYMIETMLGHEPSRRRGSK